MDSIYALSSGAVPSGVAVVRLSGPRAGSAAEALAGKLPQPRRAALRTLRHPADGSPIDQGLVLWFPAPRSETGEDMAELQVHGSRAVVQALFSILSDCGLRLAEPGEFARRAFVNGKMDLTEVEGLADLIAAETELQRRQAVGLAGGRLAALAEDWRRRLIDLRAEVEARIDFGDEGDVPEVLPGRVMDEIMVLREEMATILSDADAGERVREGFRVAILGRPNAGKSSLLNALSKRDIAIVTEEPGTTRDVLEVPLDLRGYPVVLFDTAGLRETASAAEGEGVRRARRTAESADLVLWLEDCMLPPEPKPDLPDVPVWRIPTKLDLASPDLRTGNGSSGISVKTGTGMMALIDRIADAAQQSMGRGTALVARQRQREALTDAVAALSEAGGASDEILADLLRGASSAIGRLSGRIDVEDVLDRLFAEFCIGK